MDSHCKVDSMKMRHCFSNNAQKVVSHHTWQLLSWQNCCIFFSCNLQFVTDVWWCKWRAPSLYDTARRPKESALQTICRFSCVTVWVSKLWSTNKHCISRTGMLPKQPLAVETCNTHTPSSGASVFFESACGEHSFSLYCFFSHPPTPLHNSCLSFLFPSVSFGQSTNTTTFRGCSLFHRLLSVTLTLLVRHRGLWSHSFSLVWASCPFFLLLSRGPCSLSFSLSLSLARVRALRPPPPPPSHVGSAPTSVLCTAGAVPLSPGRSLARDTPRMPQKPLMSVWLEFLYPFVWWELSWWFANYHAAIPCQKTILACWSLTP